jgi:cell wall-associated NlpC family hydrolase
MTLSYRLALAAIAITLAMLRPGAVDAQPRSFADQAKEKMSDAAGRVIHGAQDLAVYALGLIGVRYRWGGEDPDSGLDCSGLVRHVFQQVTGVTLPRTAKEMSRLGDSVAKHQLEPGDLVFFNTRRFAFSHVGIYLGDNRFIHAPRRGRDVEVADFGNSYWQKKFNGARRVAKELPAFVPMLIPTATAAAIEPASESPASEQP